MDELIRLVENNQSFLVKRILHYAKILDYTKYTSTLEEAWVMSIRGLSGALVADILADEKVPEIEVDHDFKNKFLPWISKEFSAFVSGDIPVTDIEKEYDSPALGVRNLSIKFYKMLDVSNKFEGTVILFNDLTEYKKIEEQLRFMSFHDSLTGLYNRAYLDEELIRLASGRFNPVGFISIDVDGLKLVNDHLGHVKGDSLLLNVGRILKKSFRDCDVLARMGGDEFAVIIPRSTAETVEQACQRIRSNMKEYNETHMDLPLSLSMGWSMKNLQMSSNIIEIIKEADGRMYDDKTLNRSKYVDAFKDWLAHVGDNIAEQNPEKNNQS